ncbi:PilX N-terminal domain-containing pilus assembly protein [Salinisphaera sp. T31B1]|uniref:pilus assembly PilX family protein n=1 Tax=Salinisphaera sp. T31B1 TaxID=727963 RepID=UPI003340E708
MPCHAPRGFVLITSLIFLVVITLLAVSALNSSTLQERMSSNLREKSRARQAADAGLRHAERRLGSATFASLPSFYDCNPGGTTTGSNTQTPIRVCRESSMLKLDGSSGGAYKTFLDDAVWNNPAVAVDSDSDDDVGDQKVEFFVEAMQYQFHGADLDPDRAAVGDGGVYYRITARAHGQNPNATAVTQSIYEKNY